MNFESRYQHSAAQLKMLNALFEKKEITATESLFLATEAVQHGHPRALELIDALQKHLQKNEVQIYLSSLRLQSQFIESIPDWNTVRKHQDALKKLYDLNGFQFIEGSKYPNKLIIVFTTMFNNFYMSNAVFVSFLLQFGISILILKDATCFHYLNGVKGLGGNILTVAEKIKVIIANKRIEHVLVTGFSSGGYASLFLSSLLPCDGYLGFSIKSDFSSQSTLSAAKFLNNEVRKNLDERWLVNLKDILLNNQDQCKRELYVGELCSADVEHAENLSQINNMHLHKLSCGHITLAPLMENNMLTSIFGDFVLQS